LIPLKAKSKPEHLNSIIYQSIKLVIQLISVPIFFILVKHTWASEGIRGFFPGVTLSAFGSIIAFSAYMTVYEKSKIFFSKYPVNSS